MAERTRRQSPLAGRVLLAVAAGVLLAACSAGVPSTGKVVTVDSVAPLRQVPTVLEKAGRPLPGLSPADIARGFLEAMSGLDPAQTRTWVVPDPKVQQQVSAWGPGAAVEVYTSLSLDEPASEGAQVSTVPVTLQLEGSLSSGREWSAEGGERTLPIEMKRVAGEWRVSRLPLLPLVSSDQFLRRWRHEEVFLVAPDHLHLVPAPTFVPVPADVAPGLELLTRAAVQALLQGPQGRAALVLSTAIPASTVLHRFQLSAGVAKVDLSSDFATAPGGSGRLRVGQLVWTVTRLAETAQVQITVDGKPASAVGPDRFDASAPLRRTTAPLAAMWPQRFGSRDAVLFVRDHDLFTVGVGPATQQTARLKLSVVGTKADPTWSPSGGRMAFLDRRGSRDELWTASGSGGAPVWTGVSGTLSDPSWTADGARLLVLRRVGARVELVRVSPDGAAQRFLSLPALPGGLQPTTLRLSPDGSAVLVVGAPRRAQTDGTSRPPDFGDGGQLFTGALGPDGIERWAAVAPGFGRVSSPVWIDPTSIAFIAKGGSPDNLGNLWIMSPDGWEPTQVPLLDGVNLAGQLTVDPDGESFVFTVQGQTNTSLYLVRRDGRGLRALTSPDASVSDSDPVLASR